MDSIYYFLPLAGLIALVSSGTRHEAFEDILRGALRIFLYLSIGTLLFAGLLQVSVQWTSLFYILLAAVLGLLAFYTLKEVHAWNPAVFRVVQPVFYGFALYGLDTVWLRIPMGATPKIVVIAVFALGLSVLQTVIESRVKPSAP
ncbi:MAG: hypothetical protein ACYTFG_13595, partial [Planctomycetota bacterium]